MLLTRPVSQLTSAMSPQFSAEFQALNPMMQVPALKIDGTTIGQSVSARRAGGRGCSGQEGG